MRALQVVKELVTRPIVEMPSSLREGKSAQASASKSGLLLKKNDGILVLGVGNFSVELKEFEKLSLTEQKRRMMQLMMEVQLVYFGYP